MNNFTIIFGVSLCLGFNVSASFASSVLNGWAINLDGVVYEAWLSDTMPMSGDLDENGLGALTWSTDVPGPHHIIAFFDYEIDQAENTFFNSRGHSVNPLPPELTWEIDEPGFVFGDIYASITSTPLKPLDNMTAMGLGSEDDVAMAVGFDFTLKTGETAGITLVLSDTEPPSDFYLEHYDPDSQESVYLSAALDLTIRLPWYRDADNDGYGDISNILRDTVPPAGYVSDNTDCDDTDPTVYPAALEICSDGIDQDCSGSDGAAAWSIDPVVFDFSYIKEEKAFTIENTGECEIDVAVEDTGTAGWAHVDEKGTASIAPSGRAEIIVTVDRAGGEQGEAYNTAFSISSSIVNETITIDIYLSIGMAKILFCVDTSGSMADNDPAGDRIAAIKETVAMFYNNDLVHFGFAHFSTTAQMDLNFTRGADQADLLAQIDGLSAFAGAGGWTTYLEGTTDNVWYSPGALDVVDTMIDQENDHLTHFVIIFFSDGEPTKGEQAAASIIEKVCGLTTCDSSNNSNVRLYTVYLHASGDPDALGLLNGMAEAGGTVQSHVYAEASSLSFIDLDF